MIYKVFTRDPKTRRRIKNIPTFDTDDNKWETSEPTETVIDVVPRGKSKAVELAVIPIAKGFQTDKASTPAFTRSIYPSGGRHTRAAIVHDAIYRNEKGLGAIRRARADWLFYTIMRCDGVRLTKAWMFWLMVRLFGRKAYRSR